MLHPGNCPNFIPKTAICTVCGEIIEVTTPPRPFVCQHCRDTVVKLPKATPLDTRGICDICDRITPCLYHDDKIDSGHCTSYRPRPKQYPALFTKDELDTVIDTLEEEQANLEEYLKHGWEDEDDKAKESRIRTIKLVLLKLKEETK